tara:strand:+ start:221 stop:598 length:378 start_codon:yes stop_codon:yes gene_type:complete
MLRVYSPLKYGVSGGPLSKADQFVYSLGFGRIGFGKFGGFNTDVTGTGELGEGSGFLSVWRSPPFLKYCRRLFSFVRGVKWEVGTRKISQSWGEVRRVRNSRDSRFELPSLDCCGVCMKRRREKM